MSNVKIILVGDADVGLKYAPLGIWGANKMRRDGHGHGEARSFPVDGVVLRVILDDYAGDKCYIHTDAVGCPLIEYNGYIDTFRSADAYPMGQPLRSRELQEDIEDLPRERDGEWLEGNPKMYGIRKFPAYDATKDPVPTLPPGYTLESTTYPKVSVERQTADDGFRLYFDHHKPTRYTGLMRRVLQCTFGTRTWMDALTFKATPEAPPQFVVNYMWGDSWGVILAPGKDGSKGSHYFLIQITTGEVFWVSASFCVHKVKLGTKDVFAPVLKSVQRTGAISLGTIEYVGTSQFTTIGWSFSYTEPKASVVLYDLREPADPMLYTSLATLTIGFSDGAPASVILDNTAPARLWYGSGGHVQRLDYDIAGNVVLCSLYRDFKGGPPPLSYESDAYVGVFYHIDEGRKDISLAFERREAAAQDYPLAYGSTVCSPVYNDWAPPGSQFYYSAIANDCTDIMSTGTGSLGRSGYDAMTLSTGGFATPSSSPTIRDDRVKYTAYADVSIPVTGGSTYNGGMSFINRTWPPDSKDTYYNIYFTIFIRSSGTEENTAVQVMSAVAPIPDDREAFVFAYTGTSSEGTESRSYSWISRRRGPVDDASTDVSYGSIGGWPMGIKWPGLSYYNGYVSEPPGAADTDLYYYGVNLDYSNLVAPGINEYLPPGATLPPNTSSATAPGNHIGELVYVTSCGIISMPDTDDPNTVSMLIKYYDPEQENNSYAPLFGISAYSTPDAMRYFRSGDFRSGKKGLVVIIDGKEYTVEQYVHGWIGVV